MRDPVSTIDGQVFERAAIERWFRRHQVNIYIYICICIYIDR